MKSARRPGRSGRRHWLQALPGCAARQRAAGLVSPHLRRTGEVGPDDLAYGGDVNAPVVREILNDEYAPSTCRVALRMALRQYRGHVSLLVVNLQSDASVPVDGDPYDEGTATR
jgi:hypothetical protein